jgi:hypothetical protein
LSRSNSSSPNFIIEDSKRKSISFRQKSPNSNEYPKIAFSHQSGTNLNDDFEDNMEEFENLNSSQHPSSCSINSTPTSDIWIVSSKNGEDETLLINYSDIDGTDLINFFI